MPGRRASLLVTTSASWSVSATRMTATKSHSPVTDQASVTPSTSARRPPSTGSASLSALIRITAWVTTAECYGLATLAVDGVEACDQRTGDPGRGPDGGGFGRGCSRGGCAPAGGEARRLQPAEAGARAPDHAPQVAAPRGDHRVLLGARALVQGPPRQRAWT